MIELDEDGYVVNDTDLMNEIVEYFETKGIRTVEATAPVFEDDGKTIEMTTRMFYDDWKKELDVYISETSNNIFYIYKVIYENIKMSDSCFTDRLIIRASW